MADVVYVQQFAWTCPECGHINYLSNRPRRRRAVACGAFPVAGRTRQGCGTAHTIKGLEANACSS